MPIDLIGILRCIRARYGSYPPRKLFITLQFKLLYGVNSSPLIAVSLMMDKEILLFDEPTSGLDYKNMLLCGDFLKKLAERGKVIIVVTHDEEFMNCCCDCNYQL
nr:hypothetical protein [Butyrivibrio sp. WCE2006]